MATIKMKILIGFPLSTIIVTMILQSLIVTVVGRNNVGSPDNRPLVIGQNSHHAHLVTTENEGGRTPGEDEVLAGDTELISDDTRSHPKTITATGTSNFSSPKRNSRGEEETLLRPVAEVKKLGNETLLSSRSDFPCPQAADIFPCVCTYNVDFDILLNCTNVESEEQLASVFQQEFPVKDLYHFLMVENQAVQILGNILNGVTFQRVELYPGPFILQAVSEYFLLDSLDVLEFLHIHNSLLNSDLFPFNTFNFAKNLDMYIIDGTDFTWIPPVRGPLVRELSFDVASISAMEPGTFDGVPNMQILELQNNVIGELLAGTFPIHEVPTTIKVYKNMIHIIEPGAFFMADNNSSASNADITLTLYTNQLQSLSAGTFFFRDGHMTVDLHDNQISSIEPGAFVMPSVTVLLSIDLFLNGNQLTTFEEEVFVDLLPFTTVLSLYGNPLECGCDIAWLVLNKDYMGKIDAEATCDNGTNLHDLDPNVFEAIC